MVGAGRSSSARSENDVILSLWVKVQRCAGSDAHQTEEVFLISSLNLSTHWPIHHGGERWNNLEFCLEWQKYLSRLSCLPSPYQTPCSKMICRLKFPTSEALLQDHRYFIKAGRASHRRAHNFEPSGELQHNHHQEPTLCSGLLQGHMQRSWRCAGAHPYPPQPPSNRFSLAAFTTAAQEPWEEPHGSSAAPAGSEGSPGAADTTGYN